MDRKMETWLNSEGKYIFENTFMENKNVVND